MNPESDDPREGTEGNPDAGAPTGIRAERILETCLYARDLEAAERFYTEVLGLRVIAKEAGRHVFFRLTGSVLLLFNPDATEGPTLTPSGRIPGHGARGPGHAAFLATEAELPAWRERLARHGVAIESEVVWPSKGRSIYFLDPAGNILELAPRSLWGVEIAR